MSTPGKLIVISGPSGAGKTTITHQVRKRIDAVFSVSMTTRPKTEKEVEGEDYYFVDEARFKQAIDNGELLEWAEVFGKYYGTPLQPVEEQLANGAHVILEIDVKGGIQVRNAKPDAQMFFILPPSSAVLLERLRQRGREDEQVIQKRFREAQREITDAQDSGVYDHFILNDDLNIAIEKVVTLIKQSKND